MAGSWSGEASERPSRKKDPSGRDPGGHRRRGGLLRSYPRSSAGPLHARARAPAAGEGAAGTCAGADVAGKRAARGTVRSRGTERGTRRHSRACAGTRRAAAGRGGRTRTARMGTARAAAGTRRAASAVHTAAQGAVEAALAEPPAVCFVHGHRWGWAGAWGVWSMARGQLGRAQAGRA